MCTCVHLFLSMCILSLLINFIQSHQKGDLTEIKTFFFMKIGKQKKLLLNDSTESEFSHYYITIQNPYIREK